MSFAGHLKTMIFNWFFKKFAAVHMDTDISIFDLAVFKIHLVNEDIDF